MKRKRIDYYNPTMRLTPEQEEALHEFATKNNIGVAEAIRFCCFQVIDEYPDNMPKQGKYNRGKYGLINKKKENE